MTTRRWPSFRGNSRSTLLAILLTVISILAFDIGAASAGPEWGIQEADFPPADTVRNPPPTFWGDYRWHIVGGASLCVLQTLLIVGLIVQRVNVGPTSSSGKYADRADANAFGRL